MSLKNILSPKTILTATAVTTVSLSSAFIAKHEGLRTSAYLDPVNVPTICYGATEGVKMGQKKTVEECNILLEKDVMRFERDVLKLVKVPLTENQLISITSFTYNVGVGNFKSSTLLKRLNACNYQGAANEFIRWKYAKGKVLPGLIKRRADERELFIGSPNSLLNQEVQCHLSYQTGK